MSDKNKIEVESLDNIKQQERISIICEELITMKPKRQIIEEYSKKWNCHRNTIRAIINESIVWLATASKISRDEMRSLNAERLEELFGEASGLRDKIRIIDMLNKSYGVYESNVNISGKENTEFTFSFGSDGDKN